MTMPALLDEPRPYAHETVMPREVVGFVNERPGTTVVDATAGGGGHSHAILSAHPELQLVAFDRDPRAVEATRERLSEFGTRAHVVHAAFDEVGGWLEAHDIHAVGTIVADLGISSPQLGDRERGMSFRLEGPLDMRMDPTSGATARELVESVSQDELADIIYHFGEERRSRRVARCIKQALEAGKLETTTDLRRAVVRAVGPQRVGGVDPATRTFQALRIAVNQELDQLGILLELAEHKLAPGGVAILISFHSLEDRLVKRAFLKRDVWERLTPRPLVPGEQEQTQNPKSRSAKLRAARRAGPPSEP